MVAGHETTAITTAWLFFELARNPEVQEKLRHEVLSIPDEHPTIEQLSSLHYLECVIREIIRLYPAIPSSLRVAVEDDVIPLGEPVTIKGQTHDRISYVALFVCVLGGVLTSGGAECPRALPLLYRC